jgi:hypothetical protein
MVRRVALSSRTHRGQTIAHGHERFPEQLCQYRHAAITETFLNHIQAGIYEKYEL